MKGKQLLAALLASACVLTASGCAAKSASVENLMKDTKIEQIVSHSPNTPPENRGFWKSWTGLPHSDSHQRGTYPLSLAEKSARSDGNTRPYNLQYGFCG